MKRSKFLSILGIAAVAPKIVLDTVEEFKAKEGWTLDSLQHKDFDYSRPVIYNHDPKNTLIDNYKEGLKTNPNFE